MLDPVEIWISKMEKRYSGSPSTESRYRTQLQQFCEFVGTTPQDIVTEWKNMRQTGQLIDRENYVEEMLDKIDAYEHHLGKQDLTKSSIFTYLVSVASFFKYLRIPVKLEFGNRRVVYHNRDITVEEIRRILNNSTPRDTAFYLMMIQSGLRPVTLMQLTYAQIKKDFEADRMPCHVDVPRNMTKGEYKEHFTFIGPDAVNALKAYFKGRGVPKDNETIFTGVKTASAFSMRFGYYVRNLGLIKPEDMREGRKPQQLRLYCLRKFFRNMAGPAKMPYVNFWMGHKQPGVDDHYFTTDLEDHRKQYKKFAMPGLQIFESSHYDFAAQLREKTEEIARLKRELEAKDRSMEGRIKSLEEKLGMFAQSASKRETVGSLYKKPKLTFPEWLQKHYPKIKFESFRKIKDEKLKEKILKEWEESWSEG
jgi:integrase